MSPMMMDSVDVVGKDNPEMESWNAPVSFEAEGSSLYASNQPRTSWSTSSKVMLYENGMLRVRQASMAVGRPYACLFESVPVVAIKRRSGEVDFYYISPE